MKIQRLFLTLFTGLTLCVASASAAPSAAAAKTRASEALNAMKSGDYEKFVGYSDTALVEQMGGKDTFVATTKDALANAGVKVTAVSVGDAGEPMAKGDNTFVIVPTSMTLDTPTAVVKATGFLLGISRSGGDWKFLDGSGITPDLLKTLNLELPAELTLPDKVAPTVTAK